jgi:predicted dehydrogenase
VSVVESRQNIEAEVGQAGIVCARDQRLTIGVIGAGDIVAKVHLPTLATLESVSVSWVADNDSRRAQSLGRAFRIKHCTLHDSPRELPFADVVLLAIPYGVRDQYYSFLRDWSCALYVEKPFARSVQRHREICSWYPEYKLACGFQQRSWGPTHLLSQIIEENLFGRLRSVRFGFGSPGAIVGGRYHSDVRLAGGGVLFEAGVHGIDSLLFITKAIAVEINEANMQMEGGLDLHTDAEITVTTERGEAIDCHLTVTCLQETTGQLEFMFDSARVIYSYPNGLTVKSLQGKGGYEISTTKPLLPLTSFQTFHEHWSVFLSGIREARANRTSASQTILTTEVIEKLYQAGSEAVATV